MEKTIVHTDKAPAAVGPYSQAVRVGQMIYTAGQVPLDPATGKVVTGDIGAQAEQALRNVQAVLEAAGAGLEHVIKTTVFLQDMNEFGEMNETYGRFFSQNPPARTTIEVAALPLGVRIEIEAVAFVGD